jgi:hypothetical protein
MRTAALAIGFAILSTSAFASDKITTEHAACEALKDRAAKLLDQKTAGPASGWTCDFAYREDPAFYIMRLNSGITCPYPCSNLLDWYAIRKKTGQVIYWDMAQDIPGKAL